MIRFKGKNFLIIFMIFLFILFITFYILNRSVLPSKRNITLKHENNHQTRRRTLYTQEPLFHGDKIVHLDLKGAPPMSSYYKYFFPLLSRLGATGILIEYEDMFPFYDDLEDIKAEDAYSFQEINEIYNLAKMNDLIIIPLIQTFGHMEFILKLEKFKLYREVYNYPQAICPFYNRTLNLIYNMIDQVVKHHPKLKYLHIGADEVYHLGECSRCIEILNKYNWNKKELFMHHVFNVASYIRKKYPELRVLMWDDEFRDVDTELILKWDLNKLVEPVIWKYTPDPGESLSDQLWNKYSNIWKSVWAATAFKGATGPDRYFTDITYHLENHYRWLEIIDKQSEHLHFKGVILTGWQRYDHFSILCELLVTAIPSLALNLAALHSPDYKNFPTEVSKPVMEALGCHGTISLSIPEPQLSWTKCRFYGVLIFSALTRLFTLNLEVTHMESDNTFRGWLNAFNIKHEFSSPFHVERAGAEIVRFRQELAVIEKDVISGMDGIYNNDTLEEWMETHLYPLKKKLIYLWNAQDRILSKTEWPRRPLTSRLTSEKSKNVSRDNW